MVEIMILSMIFAVVVKRGAEDVIHTARGGTPPRRAAAAERRKSGAAGRYWGQLWDDVWEDASKRHMERRERASSPSRPRGAFTVYLSNLWRDGWVRAERRRQEKATRPRPGQQTVPGTVVPNAQDEDGDRPQDRPGPEPRVVPDEDGRTDLRFGDDPTDPTGTKECPECHGTVLVDGEICPSCRDRQKQRSQHWDEQDEPDSVPDYVPDFGPDQDIDPSPATPPTEGPTMTTTMPTDTEVVSLNKAIDYSESTARVALEMVNSIDFTESSLAAGGVTGVAVAEFTSAKEAFGSIAAAMTRAAAEFKAQLAIQEAYDAHPGAGSKEFIMGGR